MKRFLAGLLAALLFVATAAMATVGDPEPAAVAKGKMAVLEQGVTANFLLASEIANLQASEDPESLRIELIACLLLMLGVSAGALVLVCFFDHRAGTQGRLPTEKEQSQLPTA